MLGGIRKIELGSVWPIKIAFAVWFCVAQNHRNSTSFRFLCARLGQNMEVSYEITWIFWCSAGKILRYMRFYWDISITSVFSFIMLLKYCISVLEKYCTSAVYTNMLPSPNCSSNGHLSTQAQFSFHQSPKTQILPKNKTKIHIPNSFSVPFKSSFWIEFRPQPLNYFSACSQGGGGLDHTAQLPLLSPDYFSIPFHQWKYH